MTKTFSPGKVETKTPEASPFKIKMGMAVLPMKKRPSGRGPGDGEKKQGLKRLLTLNISGGELTPLQILPLKGEARNPHGPQ